MASTMRRLKASNGSGVAAKIAAAILTRSGIEPDAEQAAAGAVALRPAVRQRSWTCAA